MGLVEDLKKQRIVAIVRATEYSTALKIAEAFVEGGLRLIEVAFSFHGAEKLVRELRSRDNLIVGAGTVLDIGMAETALSSGAQFIVSPHTDPQILSYAKSIGIPAIPGALTSTEIISAWRLGGDFVKVFPVRSVGGASYIRYIKEVFPFVEIMTTGGVTVDNFLEFLSAGASLIGLSTTLIGDLRAFDFNQVVERVNTVVERMSSFDIK